MRSVIKIISFTLVLSIIFAVLALPVSASAVGNYELALSIFDVLASGDSGQNTFLTQFLDEDFNSSSGCPNTSDGIHVWQYSNWIEAYPGVGNYRCMSCGLDYDDYCASAYDAGVTNMPTDNWSSAGTTKVYGKHAYAYYYNTNNSSICVYCSHYTGSNTSSDVSSSLKLTFNSDGSFSAYPASTGGSFNYFGIYYYWTIECPIDGRYVCTSSPGYVIYRTGTGRYGDTTSTKDWSGSYSYFYSAGSSFNVSVGSYNGNNCGCVVGTFYPPIYEVTPAAGTTATNYYVNASRPTYNTTYNLATVTQAGDYTVINNVYENQTIINEGDNIYTDIKTGNEYEIEGWEYDYTSRKYTCNLVDGSLLEVTFGDAYVTVELDGEVEYYYYATEDESGDEVTGGDSDCTHDFVLADSLDPTCTTGGYDVYACKLCGATQEESYFATGHDYQFLWTVLDTYEVDTSTLVCPGCNGTDITCTQVDNTENFTCVCNSTDCAQTWTVVGSTIAGYDLYQCINCQEFYNDYTHEGVDRSDAGYWSWLQTWLQNFKTWLGEKLDALINKEVAVGGDTINNEEVNNFYDQSDTNINTDADIDYAISYTDEDGTEQETSLKGIIAKFAFIKDIWKIGQTLIAVVSEDAAYAYEFDPEIGNETTTDTGTEAATVSVEEEADTLLSSSSGAPSIPLNLGAAESVYGWNYGGEVEMLELDWYTPYKETVDKLTGGFLWRFFMWKLFMKAPGILSGASMDSSEAEDVKSGTKGKRR